MFAPLTHSNFNTSSILGVCSKKAAPCVFLVLTLFLRALVYCSSGLNFPLCSLKAEMMRQEGKKTNWSILMMAGA